MVEKPDLAWYVRSSEERIGPTRCPFATAEACPRYYESLSLIGDTGGTKIPHAEDERLKKKWEKSDLWPLVGEQFASVFKANDRLSFISNFCPEVTYNRFKVFCSHLSMYTDEVDRDAAYRYLEKEQVGEDDPRWQWQHVEPLHYSEVAPNSWTLA